MGYGIIAQAADFVLQTCEVSSLSTEPTGYHLSRCLEFRAQCKHLTLPLAAL